MLHKLNVPMKGGVKAYKICAHIHTPEISQYILFYFGKKVHEDYTLNRQYLGY